jgi:hypothetical protein
MQHELKTWPEPFQAALEGKKKFEYRKDDRPFKVGDTLVLKEWTPENEQYTGRSWQFAITYILDHGFGLPEGYCIMSIDKIPDAYAPTSADLDMLDHIQTERRQYINRE